MFTRRMKVEGYDGIRPDGCLSPIYYEYAPHSKYSLRKFIAYRKSFRARHIITNLIEVQCVQLIRYIPPSYNNGSYPLSPPSNTRIFFYIILTYIRTTNIRVRLAMAVV